MNTRPGFGRSGLGQMCLSALCFSFMGLLIKDLRVWMSSSEIVFFRSLLCCIFTLSIGNWTWQRILGRRRGLLLLRGLTGFVALQLYVYALGIIPYAEAAALLYTSPLFTAVFAAWFLRERMPRIGWAALVVSLLGSILLLHPEFDIALVGGLCALTAGALSGVAYTSVRALAWSEDNLTIVLYFAMVSLPLAGTIMLPDFVWPDPWGCGVILAMGIFAQLGQVFLTRALRAGQAGMVTTGVFLTLALAGLFGWLIYDETLSSAAMIGVGCIVAGISLNAGYRRSTFRSVRAP